MSGSGLQQQRRDASGTAAVAGGRNRAGGGSGNPGAGDEDAGESSQDNRGHNLRRAFLTLIVSVSSVTICMLCTLKQTQHAATAH